MDDLQPLVILPGINTEDSSLVAGNQYVDSKNVRFWKGLPEKIGGFEPYLNQGLIGPPRGKVSWRALDDTRLAAYGTAYGLFLVYDETVHDITPTRFVEILENPFSFVVDSPIVTMLWPDHGLITNDRIILFSNLEMSGIQLSGSFIVTVIDEDHVSFDLGQPIRFISGLNYGTGQYEVTAYGGAAQGVAIRVPISSGLELCEVGGGYGGGGYGSGGYGGDVGLFATNRAARIWSLDNWGQNLVACFYGSPIYEWKFEDGPGVPAKQLFGAPDMVGSLFVSEEDRILVALGSSDLINNKFDPLLVRWSDQENNAVWIPEEANYAGDRRVEFGSMLVGSKDTVNGRLLLTNTSAYIMRYIGQPFVYSIEFVEANCGLIAPHAIGKIDEVAYWMSNTGFYKYNGTVSRVPCSQQTRLFGGPSDTWDIAVGQRPIISAGENKRFKEIIWSYSNSDGTGVNTTIALADDEGNPIWYAGDIARSTWIDDDGFLAYPVGTSEDGVIYVHEYGVNADSEPLPFFLKTGDLDIAGGSYFVTVSRLMPDFKRISGELTLKIEVKEAPQGEVSFSEEIVFDATDPILYPRCRGRSMSFELSSAEMNASFRLGVMRYGGRPSGKK